MSILHWLIKKISGDVLKIFYAISSIWSKCPYLNSLHYNLVLQNTHYKSFPPSWSQWLYAILLAFSHIIVGLNFLIDYGIRNHQQILSGQLKRYVGLTYLSERMVSAALMLTKIKWVVFRVQIKEELQKNMYKRIQEIMYISCCKTHTCVANLQ